ncbi:type II secretion system protein [Frigoribacterium sp. VKM Ac-2836]|uniref:type II secretion system protein n=1 Tax=Frigoribacterium sp. VKM Ac-2836 TaxID=2739014 RepID=UPI00352D25B4
MYFTLMGKLSARRQNLAEDKDKGFTLIELLVVVIIIGILAAIAIPVYLGVQNNAKDSSVKNDVSNFKTAVISLQTNSSSTALPAKTTISTAATLPADYASAGATFGGSTTSIAYGPSDADGFCIIGTSSAGDKKKFYATQTAGVSETACTIK